MLPDGRTAVHDGEEVTVKPKKFVPLAQAVGISQADIYTHDVPLILPAPTICCEEILGGPVVPMWSPADITSNNNRRAVVADGGPTDPCGLLGLLRRRTQKVIVQCCDAFNLLTTSSPGDNAWWAAYFGSVGAPPMSSYALSSDDMNAQCQVFDKTAFQPLVDQLVEKGRKGEPMVVDLTLDVRDNPLCGVQGGWQVRLLWCFPSLSDGFRKALLESTQAMLQRPPSGFPSEDLSTDFPYVSSGAVYTHPVVRLLAESTASDLINGVAKETFVSFFGRPPLHTQANLRDA
jgi:hypothetical protein